MDECKQKILVVVVFYYGHASSDYTSACIAMNSYCTTLKYDMCNVVFHEVYWYGIRGLQHLKIWEGDGIYEELTFGELFWKWKNNFKNDIKYILCFLRLLL
jgi:hypothetical protein